MIWTADEQDCVLTRLFNAFDNLLTIMIYVLTVVIEFSCGVLNCGSNLRFSYALRFKFLSKPVNQFIFIVDGQEGLDKFNILFA